jgi:hypothetical protein
MTQDNSPTTLTLYRWKNPETTCDYPFLALAQDRSAFLSLGHRGLSFEWSLPADAALFLAQDFAPTGESLLCDLSTLRYLFDRLFLGGVEFGLLAFDAALSPSWLGLSLFAQTHAEAGPEYLLEGLGRYRRLHREAGRLLPVTPAEHAALDVCVATFGELAAQHRDKLLEPPPPRYRQPETREPVPMP